VKLPDRDPTRTPATFRAFVAASPDPVSADAVRAVQRRLAAQAERGSVRWTPPDQFHLTLQFLGDVAEARADELVRRLTVALAGATAPELTLAGLGAFPAPAAPRVLWVGLAGDRDALQQLHTRVVAACAGLGEPRTGNDRFHPHLTLGRVASPQSPQARALAGWIASAPPVPAVRWRVDEVRLYQSRLTPAGAVHSVRARFPLVSPADA
jgi:2'-5' RNA ligase